MTYVFLDTNIFIHFRYFQDIPWESELSITNPITIVICPVVIDELDKHKYSSNKKLSARSKSLLPKLEALIEETSDCKYKVFYMRSKPSANTLLQNKLDRMDQDDLILASIIEFRQEYEHEKIIFVTNDVGPRLKSKVLEITTFKLPDSLMLPNENDEADKETLALKKELAIFKNRIPVLSVVFASGNEMVNVDRPKMILSEKEFVKQEMIEIKQKQPKLFYYSPSEINGNSLLKLSLLPFGALSEHQVKAYNDNLEEYFLKYESYVKDLYQAYTVEYHCVKIELILQNTGTLPANDIDVHFHFPDGFEILESTDFPKISRKPEPPSKPKNRFDFNWAVEPTTPMIFQKVEKSINYIPNSGRPAIKKTNSYDVDYHVRNVKHHQNEHLKKLHLKFDDINTAHGFKITYQITAAEIPQVVVGTLHLRFNYSQEQS